MVINTGKELKETIQESIMERIVQETDIQYLGMVTNKSGNLKDHIPELNRKYKVINRKISAIGAKYQHCYVGLKHGEKQVKIR